MCRERASASEHPLHPQPHSTAYLSAEDTLDTLDVIMKSLIIRRIIWLRNAHTQTNSNTHNRHERRAHTCAILTQDDYCVDVCDIKEKRALHCAVGIYTRKTIHTQKTTQLWTVQTLLRHRLSLSLTHTQKRSTSILFNSNDTVMNVCEDKERTLLH